MSGVTSAGHKLARAGVAVAYDERMPPLVATVAVPPEVVVDFRLERDREHPLGAAAADLIRIQAQLLARAMR